MRQKITFNENWTFTKPGEAPQTVDLPHTWNAAGVGGAAVHLGDACVERF